MSDYINRDPYEMQKYAKSFLDSVQNIETALVDTQMKLSACEHGLDSASMKAVAHYQESVKALRAQLDIYRELAGKLNKDADRMLRIRDSFRG